MTALWNYPVNTCPRDLIPRTAHWQGDASLKMEQSMEGEIHTDRFFIRFLLSTKCKTKQKITIEYFWGILCILRACINHYNMEICWRTQIIVSILLRNSDFTKHMLSEMELTDTVYKQQYTDGALLCFEQTKWR